MADTPYQKAGLLTASDGPRVLKMAAALGLTGGTISALVTIFIEREPLQGTAQLIIATSLTCLLMLRLKRPRMAALALVWGVLLATTLGAYLTSGLLNPTWMTMPILAMLIGWLLGMRHAAFLATGTLLSVGFTLALHYSGHSFQPPSHYLVFGIAQALIVIIAAAIGGVSAATYRRHMEQVTELSEHLQQSNADLERGVAERTAELSATVTRLRETQTELIESEKLAGLGALVAGISHELNTPIGNAHVVTTSLRAQMDEVAGHLKAGSIKRSELDALFTRSTEMLDLIERSTQRASDLIANFKQVAVDQTSEHRREFDLRAVVESHIATLRPGFKHLPWQFENRVPAAIICDSYPGPLGQIVSNLLQNAAVHAFDDRSHGQVKISAQCEADTVTLRVADDGIGMDGVTLVRIFDPFFTTKLGRGGSGLGLAICHRIARTVLGGDLTATSTLGQGSEFVLSFPRVAPGEHLVNTERIMAFDSQRAGAA